ncbi:MAG TPA: hypothetical protein V6C65_37645 [Allocoleopsis sp.]
MVHINESKNESEIEFTVRGQYDQLADRYYYTQKELHDLLSTVQFQISRSTRVRLTLIWELMAVEATIHAHRI